MMMRMVFECMSENNTVKFVFLEVIEMVIEKFKGCMLVEMHTPKGSTYKYIIQEKLITVLQNAYLNDKCIYIITEDAVIMTVEIMEY